MTALLRSIYFILVILTIILPSLALSANRHPIILIHGFIGWGRDEMGDYNYWGGHTDLQQTLIDEGFEVYTVSVGPISSNWDRAIEAFYQIKGGKVDYGIAHSEEYGLIRSPEGKNYDGLYPQWDADHPVHIIGHSMGGQTARMLEYLLKATFPAEESMLLTSSNSGWIKSNTSISTPHNGTTLMPIVFNFFPFVQKMVVYLGGMQEDSFVEKYYDFDLEQWGLSRDEDESMKQYFRKIKASKLSESKNFCAWDLSLDGALSFNDLYETDSLTYYFSYATYATQKKDDSEFHRPDEMMNWRLWTSGYMMGKYLTSDTGWYENDGVVNTISMWGPIGSDLSAHTIADFNGTSIPGIWQKMGKIHNDHEEVIGHKLGKFDPTDMKNLFISHCQLLYSLN